MNKKFYYTKITINEIKYKGSSKWQWKLSLIISIILAILLSFTKETKNNMEYIIDMFKDISIAFLAMVLGAYAIFQALLDDDLVYTMSKYFDDGESKPVLETSNEDFIGIVFLYLFSIILNIILLVIFKIIPKDWNLLQSAQLNGCLCFVPITIYFTMHFRFYIEIRNFVINIYKIFIAHNKLVILRMKNKKDGEKK